MKRFITSIISVALIFAAPILKAQKHTPLPHGMVFGAAPSDVGRMPAANIETFMDKRTRTSAVIIGRVLKVTKSKGGWFELDAGKGRVIAAHFRDYNVTLPQDLKGREVIIEGVAEKQFIADDQQHLAGQSASQQHTQHAIKTNPQQRLTFEVKGLFVNK